MGYVIDFCFVLFVRFHFFALTDVVFGGGFFCAFAVKKSVMISALFYIVSHEMSSAKQHMPKCSG